MLKNYSQQMWRQELLCRHIEMEVHLGEDSQGIPFDPFITRIAMYFP
jgi:hypothetical protein